MSSGITQKYLALKKTNARHPILPLFGERFSPRVFSSEPISEREVESMIEAARWAPSGHNFQPWYFYWTTRRTKMFETIQSCMPDMNKWSERAPLLIVACYIEKDAYGKNRYAKHDLGAAVFSLILQAQSMGYFTRQIGRFNQTKAKRVLPIDPAHTPFVILALGKIGDYTKIDEELLKRELTPRERKTDIAKRIE
jgi:nitroreductase